MITPMGGVRLRSTLWAWGGSQYVLMGLITMMQLLCADSLVTKQDCPSLIGACVLIIVINWLSIQVSHTLVMCPEYLHL